MSTPWRPSFGVDRRTVWRWVAAAAAVSSLGRPRRGIQLTDADPQILSVSDLHRARTVADRPSLRTLQRAFARALTPGQRAGLAHGEGVRRRYDTFLARAPHHRNECWEADHGQLAVEVLLPDGRVISPSLTTFIDVYSRVVMGWAVAEVPSQASVLGGATSGNPHRGSAGAGRRRAGANPLGPRPRVPRQGGHRCRACPRDRRQGLAGVLASSEGDRRAGTAELRGAPPRRAPRLPPWPSWSQRAPCGRGRAAAHS